MQATVKSPNWSNLLGCTACIVPNVPSVLRNCRRKFSPDGSTKPTTILGEYMKRIGCLVTVLICLLAALPAVYGQSVTGQISGVVVDPAGAVVPGADVQLIHDLSQTIRKFTTESNGSFFFTGLVPGTYSLKVARAGFKGYDRRASRSPRRNASIYTKSICKWAMSAARSKFRRMPCTSPRTARTAPWTLT